MTPSLLPKLRFHPAIFAAALAALLAIVSPERAEADDYPPAVAVQNTYWGGGGGSYSGPMYWQNQSITGSLYISGSTATLSGSVWQDGYSQITYYLDENGVYQQQSTWVNGNYYPFSVSGTYSQGTFSVSGVDIQSVNTDGSSWTWTPPDNGGSNNNNNNNNSSSGPTNPPFDTNPVAGGPVGLWVNGTRYYHAANGTAEDDYYPADYSALITLTASGVSMTYGNAAVSGAYTANAGGGVFVMSNSAVDLRPLAADGTQLITTTSPAYGPPNAAVNGQKWTFRGTASGIDYYLGNLAGQRLQIASSGATLFDSAVGNTSGVNGFYVNGVFQNLSEPVLPLDANGAVLSSHGQGPDTVIVNGVVWRLSTEGGANYDAYYGAYSGQVLDIYGGSVWISDPNDNINTTGIYTNGVFQMLGTNVAVQAGDSGGVALANSAQHRTQNPADNSTIAGSLDVYGNLFSLGTWQGDPTTAGLSLSFTDRPPGATGAPSTISLVANRPSNQWIWSHANTGLTTTAPMMKLDQVNRLMLFSPTDGTPQIVLDPQGSSTFPNTVNAQGRVRLTPQGDVTMGPFTNEPAQ